MSIYLARNGKILTRLNGTRYLGDNVSPVPPTPTPTEVTIGSQTWMSKNLAIDDGLGEIYTQTVNYGHGDVVEYYYTWYAAVRVAASVPGWHLPTTWECYTLSTYLGRENAGTLLKSTYGWTLGNGTDIYGFSAFPAGYFRFDESPLNLHDFGSMSPFWNKEDAGDDHPHNAHYSYLNTSSSGIWGDDNRSKMDYMQVRLIKDRQ